MQQSTEDMFIINVTTEQEQIEVKLSSHCDCDEVVHHFANIMRMMTFTSSTIIDALRNTAEELESDLKYVTNKL